MLKVKDHLALLDRLNRFISTFSGIHTLKELGTTVEKVLDDLMDIEFSGLYLYDFREQKLKLIVAKGFTEEEKREAERTALERHPGHVFRTKKILNIPDTENDPNQRSVSSARSFTVRSRLFVPVMNGDQAVGAFGIVGSKTNHFSEETVSVLSFICNIAGVIYANILAQTELRFASLIAQETDNAVIITDKEGNTEWVNRSFERITGYSFDQVKGRKPGDVLQGEETDPGIVNSIAAAIANHLPIETDVINYHKDGRPYWVSLQIQPVFNSLGEVTNFISIQRDITEQKKSQDEMARVTTNLSTLIKNLHYGVLMEDQNRKIALINKSFCDMFGIAVEPELLLGSDCSGSAEQSKLLFANPEQFVKRIDEVVRDRHPVIEEELELADGRTFHRDYIPIFFNEKFIGNIWQYRDTTERKKSETAFRKAIREAESANAAKSIFLAKMSHEIRTPLNAVIGLSKLMRDTPLNPEQQNLNDKLLLSGENLLVTINEILDFSKIEAGKIELETLPFSMAELMKRVYSLHEHAAEEKMIAFTTVKDDNIPGALIGDPARLQQVLTNLVTNAIKFTKSGRIEVSCKLVSSDRTKARVLFSVTDTGIGISSESLAHVFESFKQEDESVTRHYGGTGLGLAISKQLVGLMGGELLVESEKGKGSRFYFTITLRISDEKLLKKELKRVRFEPRILEGKKLLVVEDNGFNQFIIKSILEKWGASVDIAENGQIAVSQLWLSEYDLVLMDMQMPVMDGLTATRMIRSDLNNLTPIIALTANVTKEAVEKAFEAGMNEYISKPFEEEDLYTKVLKALGKEVSYDSEPVVTDRNPGAQERKEEIYYDLTKLSRSVGGDSEHIMGTLMKFLEIIPEYYDNLQNAYDQRQFTRLHAAAHKLKSSVDLVASKQIRDLVQQINDCSADASEHHKLGAFFHRLKKVFPLMISQVEELIREYQGDKTTDL